MIAGTDERDRPHKKKKKAAASEILQREVPFDREAEMGVLGSILLLPEVCDDLASILRGRLLRRRQPQILCASSARCTTKGKRSTSLCWSRG